MSDKGRQYRVVGGFYDGPAIGRLEGEAVIAIRNRRGDARLIEACHDLFANTANLRGLTMDEAVAYQLGRCPAKPIPGTERIHQTQSAKRLVA